MEIEKCDKCDSEILVHISAKCSDMFGLSVGDHQYDGYVPYGINIGGGDYIDFCYCATCGKIQGNFPIVNLNEI